MFFIATSQSHQSYRYLHGVDGLRAIAVFAVILFHLQAAALPGGFTGVDVFFLISGYVVSKSLAGMSQSSFWLFLRKFYVNRVFRLYPALIGMLVIVTLLQVLFIPASWLSSASANAGVAAFFGLSNFALVWSSDGYFSPRVEFNPFTHTWSLAVEEQFYLLFPALFFPWIQPLSRNGLFSLAARLALPLLLFFSFLLCWRQTQSHPDQAYYLLPSRFWELASGAILFLLHRRQKLLPVSTLQIESCIWGGLILIALGFYFSDAQAFPFPWALVPVFGAALVISGVAAPQSNKTIGCRLLAGRLICYFGRLSYSLYLWHWPIIVLLRWTVGVENLYFLLGAAIATLIAGALSYHFLEVPLRRRVEIVVKSEAQRLFFGGVAILGFAVLALGIVKAQPYLSMSVTRNVNEWYPYAEEVKSEVRLAGNPLSQHRLYVLGDSHTGAYSKLLSLLSINHGIRVEKFSQAGCAIAGLIKPLAPECVDFARKSVEHILSQSVPGDVVLLASLRVNRLGDQWAAFDSSEIAAKQYGTKARYEQIQAVQEASQLIGRLQKAGLFIIIDAPKPIFASPPFRCADWFNRNNPICDGGLSISRSVLLDHRQPTMLSLAKLQKQYPDLIVWDPFPILCPGEICYAYDGETPLFFDGDHLSGHGNRVLYPALLAQLQALSRPTKNLHR